MSLSKREQNTGAVISFFAIVLLLLYLLFMFAGLDNEELLLLTLLATMVISACVCFITLRKLRKAGEPLMIDYLNVGVQRYILGIFMVFYGVPKLTGTFFDYQLFALDSKLGEVSEFELAWYYFGKNRWQELFSGIMEFIPGLLLLSRRTYYIAALILLPVTAQVFILNFFFKIGGVTFPAALILLCCNIYIIYSQKEKIIHFFSSLDLSKPQLNRRAAAVVRVMRITSMVLVIAIIVLKFKPVFFTNDRQVAYRKLVGAYSLEQMKKNSRDHVPTNDSLIYKDLYIEKQDRWNVLRTFNNETQAFILRMDPENDSIKIYLNRGGIGDGPDIIDTATVLKGVYKLGKNNLTISGVQMGDTLLLNYKRRDIKPKQWFW